jgi:hypothetical protein
MTLDHDPFIDPDCPTITEAYDPRLDSVVYHTYLMWFHC